MAAGAVLGGLQLASQVGGGLAGKRASKALARQAELDAKSEEVARMRDLNDAMAMQALMFGASGASAGVGSAATATQESLTEFEKDIKMIRAGGRAKAAGIRAKGAKSLMSSIGSGLMEGYTTKKRFDRIGKE